MGTPDSITTTSKMSQEIPPAAARLVAGKASEEWNELVKSYNLIKSNPDTYLTGPSEKENKELLQRLDELKHMHHQMLLGLSLQLVSQRPIMKIKH
jgi:VanZ family protein